MAHARYATCADISLTDSFGLLCGRPQARSPASPPKPPAIHGPRAYYS